MPSANYSSSKEWEGKIMHWLWNQMRRNCCRATARLEKFLKISGERSFCCREQTPQFSTWIEKALNWLALFRTLR